MHKNRSVKQENTLAAKPDEPSLVSLINMVDMTPVRTNSNIFSSDLHTCIVAHSLNKYI